MGELWLFRIAALIWLGFWVIERLFGIPLTQGEETRLISVMVVAIGMRVFSRDGDDHA